MTPFLNEEKLLKKFISIIEKQNFTDEQLKTKYIITNIRIKNGEKKYYLTLKALQEIMTKRGLKNDR